MNLKDKVVLVTGASDGIGREIALRLAKEGVKLALLARDKAKLHEVSQLAKNAGSPEVEVFECDIRKSKDIISTVEKVLKKFKQVDVLVNNAGVWQKLGPLESISDKDIDDIVATNLTGLMYLTKALMLQLKSRPEAIILNVISQSGVVAQEGQSVYTASKYGVRGFTEVLKAEFKDTNVRVGAVYQSGTNTKMFEKAGDYPPVEKFTEPADLAEVVAFMLTRPPKIWLHDVRVEY
ncbi:MAG: SDR family oxidoreductase [Candidatus Woesearchaeota archaeon]